MFSTKTILLLLVIFSSILGKIIFSGQQGADYVASDRWMRTNMNLFDDGFLHAITTLQAQHIIEGFTGGVNVTFFDENNNQVWQSQLHKFGVNLHSTRVQGWSEQVPLELIPKIKKFAIVHQNTPSGRANDTNAYINLAITILFKSTK